MTDRNHPPESASDIAACLNRRYQRLHGSELTERKVEDARRGNIVQRRAIEQAGGGSLLPVVGSGRSAEVYRMVDRALIRSA